MPRHHLLRFNKLSGLDIRLASGLCVGCTQSTYFYHTEILAYVSITPFSCVCMEKMPGGRQSVNAGQVVHQQLRRVWELVGPNPSGRALNGAACPTDDHSSPMGGKALPQLQRGGDAP